MSANQQAVQPRRSGGLARALQRLFMRIHTALYRGTGGAIAGKFGSRSFLLLITTGRKSSRERVTPIFYQTEGNDFILVASNWGAATNPIWWLNLQANPQAKVQIGRNVIHVTARQASSEERSRLWSSITSRYPDFANYQKQTSRQIPIVLLTPLP